MSDTAWKFQERRMAKALGTLRNSLSSRMSKAGTDSDTLSKGFYVGCKYRKEITVIKWFQEIIPKARRERKVLIIALRGIGRITIPW